MFKSPQTPVNSHTAKPGISQFPAAEDHDHGIPAGSGATVPPLPELADAIEPPDPWIPGVGLVVSPAPSTAQKTWSVLTNGDVAAPELIFAGGDVIMTSF